jgi:uncharacterized protein YggE
MTEIEMKSLLCAAALGALTSAMTAPAALAQAAPPAAESLFRATTLNLSAYGETKAPPDMATIALGVQTEAPTAAAAMAANARQMSQVMAALKAAGIAAKDIQTSNLNLSPRYAYGKDQPPRLTGYQASNDVTVAVRDLARLGAAVDATVSAGANQVNGIAFGLSDPTAAENAARLDAVKALQAKADLYARATGYRILRMVSLGEGGGYAPPRPIAFAATAEMRAAAPTPVSPGELKVRVDVTGLYELAR